MGIVKIGDREFNAHALPPKEHAWFMARVHEFAKQIDCPLARFAAVKLKGVTGKDRKTAIRAFLSLPGWDSPGKDAVAEILVSLPTVILLCRLAIDPEPGYEELKALITDPAQTYAALCKAMAPPTNEEIIARNRAFRARLTNRPQKGEDGEPCQQASPVETL
jgi:hypothetical protein